MQLLGESVVPESARGIKAEAREFAAESIEPVAAEYHDSGEYPWEVLDAARAAGLSAADIPERYGGRGLSLHQSLAIVEEFFRADAGIGLTLQLSSFGAKILVDHGTDEQCERYLPPIANGEAITGLAVSEPQTGSDLAGMETTARKDGDEYVLDGEKYWIGNGVEAEWLTVYAKTGDGEDPHENYSMFVVPTDADGYHAEHVPEKMGFRASKQAHVTFDGVRIPAENLIGREGEGFYMVADFFNSGRVIVGGHGTGLAAAAIEEAEAFVSGRDAFDRQISEFQAVRHSIADMLTEFEAARTLVWQAADRVAAGHRPGYWAAVAKMKATETATECAEEAMQLHGGRSMLLENRITRIYRDVRAPVIYEGASEIQRDLIYKQAPR
ncbi:MAG: acyl-CoA dehydrogenase [Natronomonas sp.]